MESEIVQILSEKLNNYGFDTYTEYRVPGANIIIDCFIPFIPPAIIEVKIAHSDDGSIERTTRQVKHYQDVIISQLSRIFHGPVIAFIVICSNFTIDKKHMEIDDQFVHYFTFLNHPMQYDTELGKIASEITAILHEIRKKRQEWAIDLGVLNKWSKFAADNWKKPILNYYNKNYENIKDNDLICENNSLPTVRGRNQSKEKVIQYQTVDQIQTILKSFLELVTEDQFIVIEQEISHLLVEYESAHFTACALRAGRCLEYMVYALARAWNVPVDECTISYMNELLDRINEINSQILKFKGARFDVRSRIKQTIIRMASELSGRITVVVSMLDNMLDVNPANGGTRNIESILRDIRYRYGRHRVVREKIENISGIVRATLDLRNKAAHASSNNNTREVEKSQVETMIDNLELILFDFSIIGRTITEREKE